MPTTTTCRSCRAGMREADRFCWTCGEPRDAAPTDHLEVVHASAASHAPARAPREHRAPKPARTAKVTSSAPATSAASPQRPSRGQSGRVIAALAVVLVGAVGASTWWLLRDDDPVRTTTATPSPSASASESVVEPSAPEATPEPTPTETAPAVVYPTGVLQPARATAPSTSPSSADAAGRTTSYGAANMLDATPSTAWRTEGSAAGDTLTFTFDSTVRITEVGLINGFAKVDPADGTDRYPQGRRITAVTWTFQTATGPVVVSQNLDDGVRDLQNTAVAPIEATAVELTIDAVTSPGAGGRFDRTAISDVRFANS